MIACRRHEQQLQFLHSGPQQACGLYRDLMSSSGDVTPTAETPRPRSGRPEFVVPRRVAEVQGRDFALQFALTHGLGLVGAGAPAAARAFLAETLSEQPPGKIVIVIPA